MDDKSPAPRLPMHDTTHTIRDGSGNPIAYYEYEQREARPWAEDLRWADESTATSSAVPIIVQALPGWAATTDADLGTMLLNAGADVTRRFHTYSMDLAAQPPTAPAIPDYLRHVPAQDVVPTALHEALSAAYPPEHPDYDDNAFDALDGLYDGSYMGKLMPCSTVLLDGDRAIAAALVNDTGGDPPDEGPWISDIFRIPGPEYAGVGAMLLRLVMAAAASTGIPALGLSVHDANPARRVYERLGFRHTGTYLDLILPEPNP